MIRTTLLASALTLAVAPVVAQDSLVDFANANGVGPTNTNVPIVSSDPRGSSLTFYADRTAFDAAFPTGSQTCEDFETNLGADGAIIGFAAPLDSTTDNAVFAAGSIIPDLSITDDPINDSDGMGGAANGLVFVGATAFGTPSDLVASNTFVDSTNINILTERTAIAGDVFSFTAGGTATVSVFDTADNLLGSIDVAAGPAASGFFGVSAPVAIGRVNVFSQTGGGADEAESMDNICLSGTAEPVQVPTLGRGGILLMLLGLAILGVIGLRARAS